jgi:large subunit ribosomal protein L24
MAARKRHEAGEFRAHVKKGDTVKILCGRSRGEKGRIIEVLPRHERAVVEGANLIIRHQRARGGQRVTAEQQSGRIEKPAPIHLSNLMLVCPSCGHETRIRYQEVEGQTVRVCKNPGCGEVIDKRK